MVYFLLPQWMNEQSSDNVAVASSSRSTNTTVSERTPENRAAALTLLESVLKKRAALEALGVAQWAGSDFQVILQLIEEADQTLGRGAINRAKQLYGESEEKLDKLLASRPERLGFILNDAAQAIEQNRLDDAKRLFSLGLLMEPENPDLNAGLAQLEKREKFNSLLISAQEMEESGQPLEALRQYQTLLRLQPNHHQAVEAVARIESTERERQFRPLMSRILTALEQGDLVAAAVQLKQLKQLNPEAPEVKDTELRLASAQRSQKLLRHKQQGEAAEKSEAWKAAATEYRLAINIDPNAAFAKQGLSRALKGEDREKRLNFFIERPERLGTDKNLQSASQLLNEYAQMRDAGPKLQHSIDQLQQLVSRAGQRIAVTIYSDNLTNIVIYHVGRLGQFRQHQLELRPGTYTILGTRKGYRDVLRKVEIGPDKADSIELRCEESI